MTVQQPANPTRPERIRRMIEAIVHETRYRPREAWGRFTRKRRTSARRKKLHAWFDELRAHPPDILIGANTGSSNGIRFHMEGIKRHSAMSVALAPPDDVIADVSWHDLHTTFRDEIMGFAPVGIDVLHSHVYPWYVQWCRRHSDSGRLWVHTYHLPYFATEGALLPWQQEINDSLVNEARHAHVRISVSAWQQVYLREEHGIETVHIPNGVDADSCDRAVAARFHAEYRVDRFVLFVGRNEPVKNPHDFVRLAASMPDTSFVAIGEGMSPEPLEASFGAALPANLTALGGLPRDRVQDALAACSALVVTSRREGLPTLVLEALLREKPVVVPDDPGCIEAVDGGRFGSVYRQGDASDLRSKTTDALSSVGDDRRAARQWVLDKYDWKVVAPRIDEIYRGALPADATRRG